VVGRALRAPIDGAVDRYGAADDVDRPGAEANPDLRFVAGAELHTRQITSSQTPSKYVVSSTIFYY